MYVGACVGITVRVTVCVSMFVCYNKPVISFSTSNQE